MKRLVVTTLIGVKALNDGVGGAIEMETNEGPLELRFTYQDAERLIAAFSAAREKIQTQRAGAGEPPLAVPEKLPQRWETAVDPVNQVAVIRARFADQTTQETAIPRAEIGAITEFLQQAARRFEAGAEMRQ